MCLEFSQQPSDHIYSILHGDSKALQKVWAFIFGVRHIGFGMSMLREHIFRKIVFLNKNLGLMLGLIL